MSELHEIRNVEIFATGLHNGDRYTISDLDEMVRAFEASDFRPPVKLGHSEEAGRPAFGWIDNLRRVGHKLVADLTHVPTEIYRIIKRRGYDTVSAEVYWNLERGGKVFRRALKALALLGQEVPAVAGLQPLHALFAHMRGTVKLYTVDVGNGAGVDDWWRAALPMKMKTYGENSAMTTHDKLKHSDVSPEEAGARLATYSQELSRREGIPLHEAQVRVVQQHPKLAEIYERLGQHAKYRQE